MKYYMICDWAGNRITEETFESFEDAWDYILGDLTDRLSLTEEDYQEYEVRLAKSREARYLDPTDPRRALKAAIQESV